MTNPQNSSAPSPHTILFMCIVQCQEPIRSAKGSNYKEDDRALSLYM